MDHVREREYNNRQRAFVLLRYLHQNEGRQLTHKQVRDHFGWDRHTLYKLLVDIEYALGHLVTVRSGHVLYVDKEEGPGY